MTPAIPHTDRYRAFVWKTLIRSVIIGPDSAMTRPALLYSQPVTGNLQQTTTDRLLDGLAFVAVGAYLTLVSLFLLVSGRLRPSLGVRRLLRPRRRLAANAPPVPVENIVFQSGHCFLGRVPAGLISDQDGRSRLILREDGRDLPHPHALHETIRQQGAGTYSHWGDMAYFSSSDNSDPRANKRAYDVVER